MSGADSRLLRVLRRVVRGATTLAPAARGRLRRPSRTVRDPGGFYPGDFVGMPSVAYTPVSGNRPDPGEVVWAWVPFEEDHARGKDRPVLLIGRDRRWLLGLPLTSLDHDRDAAQEAREGRYWFDIGSGPWDPRGRRSEARVNRIIRLNPDAVRRTSAALDREIFDRVIAEVRLRRGR
ncbi:MAG: type II toxin-antitoxin system PemK/MazF family toxin [Propionibacteriaceae bacterium]|nr:type II toxin-antitoxin system PemK/MazF family toxin [Propionibacteriaceae bacterium]